MLTHGALCSSLEGSNQIVSDQGVRKNLYQKVRMPVFPSFALGIESTNECFVDRRCVPRRLVILGPDLARSERDEEEIREGVDGGRLTEPEQDRTETETEQSTHSRRGSYRRWTRIPCVVLYSVPTLPRVNHVRPRPRLRLRIHLHLRVCRSSYLLCSLIRPLTCTLGY